MNIRKKLIKYNNVRGEFIKMLYIIIGIIVSLIIYVLVTENKLVESNNSVENAFLIMSVYLRKGWNLMSNLVKIKKKYVKYGIAFVLFTIISPNCCNAKTVSSFSNSNYGKYNYVIDNVSVFIIIVSLICVAISFIIWAKYGKDKKIEETLESYPPEGYNSAEIGFLYEGSASDKGVISLLIYLANKGYLQIEEIEENTLFSKSKDFRITKLKEYDGNNQYEKIFFKGLFKNGTAGTVNMEKAREIMQEAKSYGEKISFQNALELSTETGSVKKFITATNLYNSFYETLDRIKSNLNSEENIYKIFETTINEKGKLFVLMMIVIFTLITLRPIMEYSKDGSNALVIAVFSLIMFTAAFIILFSRDLVMYVNGKRLTTKRQKIFASILLLMIGLMGWLYAIFPCLLQNMAYLITYFIGIACIGVVLMFLIIMPKRTTYGNEILEKIKGFRSFLETAEKPQLENLIIQNPEYFYNMLPYAYALGIFDVWINKFENISLEAPHWYKYQNNFSVYTFGTFMKSTMNEVSLAMTSDLLSSIDDENLKE